MQKDRQEQGMVVGGGGGAKGGDIYWTDGDKRFEVEGGGERVALTERGGGRLYSGGIHVGGVRREVSHSVSAEGEAPRVRAAKSSEFG